MCKELKILFVTSHSYNLHHKKKQMTLLIEWNTQIQKQKLSMTVMNPNPKGELVTNTANVAIQDTTNIHAPVKSTFIYFIFIIIIPLIKFNM